MRFLQKFIIFMSVTVLCIISISTLSSMIFYKNTFSVASIFYTTGVLKDKNELGCFRSLAKEWKSCILEKLVNTSTDKRDWMLNDVKRCFNAINYTRNLKLVSTENADELKYFVLPKKGNNSKCSVVSLGIGGDIAAEVGLKKILPTCQFYGADPVYNSGKVFNEIGKYYQVAVGGKDGNYTASILKGGYVNEIISHVSFIQFLKLANLTFIDYLIMDAEGAEYGIFKHFETDIHGRLSPDNTVCQINAELHHPFEVYGTTERKFNEIYKKFITDSPYVPVLVTEHSKPKHYRTVWINILNNKCIEKYLPDCT